MPQTIPKLITAGVIASKLGVPIHRVQHILATRSHIRPSALAANVRLYSVVAVAQVLYQLNVIDAKRASGAGEADDV